jgi:hypothetical protein
MTQPQVAAVGDRFLVTWVKQSSKEDPEGEGTWGRWVSATGEMSPARRLPIEQDGYPGVTISAAAGVAFATWSSGSHLRRAAMGAGLDLGGPIVDLADGPASTNRFAEIPAPGGGTWLAFPGRAMQGATPNIRLLRLDAAGHPVGPPTEVSNAADGWAGSPALLVTPDGLLAAWNLDIPSRDPEPPPEPAAPGPPASVTTARVLRDREHPERAGVWIRRLDARGEPREQPRPIAEAHGAHQNLQLFRAPGGPVLVWGQHAKAMALSWEGAPLALPTTLAPLAQPSSRFDQKWLAADGDPWVVFTDIRHARIERFAARVQCGGEVPAPASSIPVVARRAEAPPPRVAAPNEMRCPQFAVDRDLDVGPARLAEAPQLAESGGDLWIAWRDVDGPSGLKDAFASWRRLRLLDGRLLDQAPARGPRAEVISLARGDGMTLLFEGQPGPGPTEIRALSLADAPALGPRRRTARGRPPRGPRFVPGRHRDGGRDHRADVRGVPAAPALRAPPRPRREARRRQGLHAHLGRRAK